MQRKKDKEGREMAMNECFFTGNLARDMELCHTARGMAVGEFTLCVDTNRKYAKGEWVRHPNYFRCRMVGSRADALATQLVKGAKVVVRATARWEGWTDAETGKAREAVRFCVNDITVMEPCRAYAAAPEEAAEDIPF